MSTSGYTSGSDQKRDLPNSQKLSRESASGQPLETAYGMYHAVHEDELQVVFVERLVAILVVGHPDVAGNGCCDSGICVSIAGIRKKGALIVQEPGGERRCSTESR